MAYTHNTNQGLGNMRLLLITILSFLPLLSFADNPAGKLVKVNLIVFMQKNTQARYSEDWLNQLLMPNTRNALNLKPYIDPDSLNNPDDSNDAIDNINQVTDQTMDQTSDHLANTPYEYNDEPVYALLSPDNIGLTKMTNRLNKSGYPILLNIAWIQPVTQNNRRLHIFGGTAYDETGQPITDQVMNANNMQAIDGAKFWQLNGTLRISYNNYFNISQRLYLTLPTNLGSDIDAQQFGFIPLQTFKISTNRRARAKQMVYFDHPVFGVLLQITPVKENEPRHPPA